MAVTTDQKASLLYKNFLGKANTRVNREFFEEAVESSLIVKASSLWTYSDMIPDGTDRSGGNDAVRAIMALDENTNVYSWYKSEEEPECPLVKFWYKLKLQAIDSGTDNAFIAIDPLTNEKITDIIPFNYYEEVYNYTVYDNLGNQIYFGVGDWVFDHYSSVLTFYGDLPTSVDHNRPPSISFYQYLGGKGFKQEPIGFQGAILPLNGIEIPLHTTVFTGDSKGTLKATIIEKANQVEDNFTNIYGFDGTDDNAGIGLRLEKMIPLLYSQTKDNVKGHDLSANSDINTVLSDREIINSSSITGANLIFASESTVPGKTYQFTIDSENFILKLDDGIEKTYSVVGKAWDSFRIDLDQGFIILQKTSEHTNNILNGSFEIRQSEEIYCALLYWDSLEAIYQAYTTDENNSYDFGFTIIVPNGKLPPSLMLGSDSLSSFNDSITPDYYGPRVKSVVIALNTETNIKSSDYIVYNDENRYLNDIFDKIKEDYPNFKGTIYLRPGTYYINRNLNLSDFSNTVIESENNSALISAIDDFNIVFNSTASTISITNLQFSEKILKLDITTDSCSVFLSNIIAKKTNIDLNQTDGSIFISNVSMQDITINGDDSEDLANTYISGSFFEKVIVRKSGVLVRSCILDSYALDSNKKNFIKNTVINTLKSKYKDLIIDGSTILGYDTTNIGSNRDQTPVSNPDTRVGTSADTPLSTSGRFPIFDKDDFVHLKFAEFARPFSYNSKKEMVELLYDRQVLAIKDGILTTNIALNKVMILSETDFPRHNNSGFNPLNKTYQPEQTLYDILKDLFLEKADLDRWGKIPLQELPDSVAYGGLLFVGTWSFEKLDNNGERGMYPTYKDAIHTFTKDPSQVEGDQCDRLQKGWFFIVEEANGREPGDKDTENDNPVKEQEAVDKEIFTAGDWVVYQGDGSDDKLNQNKSWVKIDRAYQDPAYTILPSKANVPGEVNEYWWWKDFSRGGALDLTNDTIIEAFSKINKQLRRLEPAKPSRIIDAEFEMAKDYPKFYYRELFSNGSISAKISETYDSDKITEFSIVSRFKDRLNPVYSDYIYYGDSAKLSVMLDGDSNNLLVKDYSLPVNEELQDNPVEGQWKDIDYSVKVIIPNNLIYIDHEFDFWSGFYLESRIQNNFETEGTHSFSAVLSEVIVGEKDKNHAWNQYLSTYGGTSTFRFDCRKAYWPERLDITFATVSILSLRLNGHANMCSGIRMINIDQIGYINGLTFAIKDLYKSSMLPSGPLYEIRGYINGLKSQPFTEVAVQGTDNGGTVKFSTLGDFTSIAVEDITLVVTHDSNIVIEDTENIDIIATFYDLYGVGHEALVGRLTNERFDRSNSNNRLTAGRLANDSAFNNGLEGCFGAEFNHHGNLLDSNGLLKIGRMTTDRRYVSEYRWPSGNYNGESERVDYNQFVGEKFTENDSDFYYASACFYLGNIRNASGLMIEFSTDQPEYWGVNSLTGGTNGLILQLCLVNGTEKATSFLDGNSPNDGFKTPDIHHFNEPVMYAGLSTATRKRITFGKQTLSGDVYLRVGIEKLSKLTFTEVKLTQII